MELFYYKFLNFLIIILSYSITDTGGKKIRGTSIKIQVTRNYFTAKNADLAKHLHFVMPDRQNAEYPTVAKNLNLNKNI